MSHFHAAVWIDHDQAHVYALGLTDVTTKTVKNANARRIHHKAGSGGAGHERESNVYFEAVCSAIGDAKAILIVGPSGAKTEFKSFVGRHYPKIYPYIVGVEALDRETDGEVIAFARKFFASSDLMTPQRE